MKTARPRFRLLTSSIRIHTHTRCTQMTPHTTLCSRTLIQWPPLVLALQSLPRPSSSQALLPLHLSQSPYVLSFSLSALSIVINHNHISRSQAVLQGASPLPSSSSSAGDGGPGLFTERWRPNGAKERNASVLLPPTARVTPKRILLNPHPTEGLPSRSRSSAFRPQWRTQTSLGLSTVPVSTLRQIQIRFCLFSFPSKLPDSH